MFKNILVLLLVFLLLSCTKKNNEKIVSEPSEQDIAIETYDEAVEALKRGDSFYASKKFKEVEGLSPQSEWAAKAALADAYLNIEDWTNSRDMAEDIISNGPFSLVEVKVADDFLQIYGPESITHSGEIFSAHQSETNGNGIATHIHRPNTGFSVGGYYAWLPVEGSLVWDWDTNDLRQQFSIYTEYFDENDRKCHFLAENFF